MLPRLDAAPAIRALTRLSDDAVRAALRDVPPEARPALEHTAKRAAKKAIHDPLMKLRAGDALLEPDDALLARVLTQVRASCDLPP